MSNRLISFDTETTGLSVKDGHRIVEIACVELENLIKTHELIGQICMVGDGKKFLSALIVLDGDGGAEKWANENGVDYNIESMSKNEKVF